MPGALCASDGLTLGVTEHPAGFPDRGEGREWVGVLDRA